MTLPDPTLQVEVRQEDREAAARMHEKRNPILVAVTQAIRERRLDDHDYVRFAANVRLSAERAAIERAAEMAEETGALADVFRTACPDRRLTDDHFASWTNACRQAASTIRSLLKGSEAP